MDITQIKSVTHLYSPFVFIMTIAYCTPYINVILAILYLYQESSDEWVTLILFA